jgi:pyruvate-ferredoxin/flavodoxin oxidoreductase
MVTAENTEQATWEAVCVDGNEAAARVAYALSEVVAIYPITPASPMGENVDSWAAAGRPNLWGQVPTVVEMQSEAGAAGALHGALEKGSLATTFTASQGLLLMLPNMFKIAGELLPCVIHVAARSVATHALSIFGDHSDVMAARSTGWAMLCANSVQEAQDLALVAHLSSLRSRVPFVHFFDGFRTSHELATITPLRDGEIASLVDQEALLRFWGSGMSPDRPDVRGTAQNPDVFFQGREAANRFYLAVPGIVEDSMSALGFLTGRRYGLVEYTGPADAERVVVVMGSAAGTVEETVSTLAASGEKVGVVKVRLYRPFPSANLVRALPPTVRAVAVLDRCKEPGSVGEPLYLDVRAAIDEAQAAGAAPFGAAPLVVGGRYGLGSKEFTPSMAKAVFDELAKPRPKQHFTVGVEDDLTSLSLTSVPDFAPPRPEGELQAVFFGVGSDGTVGANKNSAKIIVNAAQAYAQGYFVYDSKKSGSMTVSHLRLGPQPIGSAYLVERADFVACHQFGLLQRTDVLRPAKRGATLLLNSPYAAGQVWHHLPLAVRRRIVEKEIEPWVVDAQQIASAAGLGNRVNTVMQTCFFALSKVLPVDQAVAEIKTAIEKTYGKRGREVVARNFAAVDAALAGMARVEVPADERSVIQSGEPGAFVLTAAEPAWRGPQPLLAAMHGGAHPAEGLARFDGQRRFVQDVTLRLIAGEGDQLPTSAMPADGRFPSGTACLEKRAIATEIPVWDPDICTDCGKCALVCPHSALRMKVFPPDALEKQGEPPEGFLSKPFRSKDLSGHLLSIQVSPDDCTGCGLCVEACTARSRTQPGHKSLEMAPVAEQREAQLANWEFFRSLPRLDRSLLPHDTVKGAAVLEPLFEFPGACAGCGETPYLKLLSQLFGDRLLVANATGCSSIYGGNLPTTPWTFNEEGRGPAWANSLFEDNAEFGLGIRLGLEAQERAARDLLGSLAPAVGQDLVEEVLGAAQDSEEGIVAQRRRVAKLKGLLSEVDASGATPPSVRERAAHLLTIADSLVRKSVWIVGGDGWAYDIGFGGLDHVLSSGANVNVLVLDTEVYSNTGGQASKSTQRAAVARFASSGKATPKKDLGATGRAYGNVFVAQVAMGANDIQTVKALLEADAHPGPSLVIAYAPCIEHGLDMVQSLAHAKDAVRSGYWPLYRFRPSEAAAGHPFKLDSREPTVPVSDFARSEVRYASLVRRDPEHAAQLLELLEADTTERWRYYQQLAGMERTAVRAATDGGSGVGDGSAGDGPGERPGNGA